LAACVRFTAGRHCSGPQRPSGLEAAEQGEGLEAADSSGAVMD